MRHSNNQSSQISARSALECGSNATALAYQALNSNTTHPASHTIAIDSRTPYALHSGAPHQKQSGDTSPHSKALRAHITEVNS
jgi:hypothetical protein